MTLHYNEVHNNFKKSDFKTIKYKRDGITTQYNNIIIIIILQYFVTCWQVGYLDNLDNLE